MKKLKAFSLLELMIVLSIMGILMISISQGNKLMNLAKVQKTINQITLLKNIDKNDLTIDAKNDEIWNQLIQANQISKKEQKPAVGGIFFFEDLSIVYLAANKDKKGILNLETAQKIKQEIDGTLEEDYGSIKIKLGSNLNTYPDDKKEKAYILEISI
ncbi:prepilin-type N-terminal cleavage/methylation domain-containing protein [Alphaproteobacteria bacterium endosymbiont of Tiliacea citrago]|uniref:pilus assembly FimT family protein n=1 Tax=Alphaproteobacteria bacterium endosymbiont of Tiliacea citrago TaxID=3077944 RepID=UPI00313D2EFC